MKLLQIILLFFLTNLNSAFAQCIEGDCFNGTGIFKFDSGAQYSGEFKNGKVHKGEYIFSTGEKYTGEFKDDQIHGYGKIVFNGGDVYEGEWKNMKINGYGEYTYISGDKYVGNFKNGKQHGQGTTVYSDGTKYIGEWKEGERHGQGTWIESDGAKYIGEWKEGERHGQGTFIWSDGRKYIGEWKKDEIHGEGIFNYVDGRVVQGTFKYGRFVKEHEVKKIASSKENIKDKKIKEDNKKTEFTKVSTDIEMKGYKIYDNFSHNWTLFGIKLYNKIENLKIIGKITKNYETKCIEVKNLDGEKLKLNKITDNKGCLSRLYSELYTPYGDFNYLVEPINKNDLFSLYIISLSPLEKRILSILGIVGESLGKEEVCVNQGNSIIKKIYDQLSKQNNFKVYRSNFKKPRNFGTGYLIYDSVALDYDPIGTNKTYKDLFADYKFECIDNDGYDFEDKTYLSLKLTDWYVEGKKKQEQKIIEENKLQLEKNKTKDKFENTLQNGVF